MSLRIIDKFVDFLNSVPEDHNEVLSEVLNHDIHIDNLISDDLVYLIDLLANSFVECLCYVFGFLIPNLESSCNIVSKALSLERDDFLNFLSFYFSNSHEISLVFVNIVIIIFNLLSNLFL